jgi:hypothetical protein
LSDQPGAAAHDDFRDLPDRPSLRHLKLEAKRRLAAEEFTTLHDAQLAVAREHGMSSWAALKEHIAAAEAEQGHALAQVRWVFGRYAEADAPGWAAPSRDELSEHFTEQMLGLVSPEAIAKTLGTIAARLRHGLVVIDADSLRLSAKIEGLVVEATVEPEAPHRLDMLRLFPDGLAITDTRVTRPPAAGSGPVPEQVPGIVKDSYAKFGLVGLTAAGDPARPRTARPGRLMVPGRGPGLAGRGARLPAGRGRLARTRAAAGVRVPERRRAVVDRAGPGSLRVRLADTTPRRTRRAGAASAGPAA